MSADRLQELVFLRANGLCEYCKSPAKISLQPFVIEHVIPQSKGGNTTEDNLARLLARDVTTTNTIKYKAKIPYHNRMYLCSIRDSNNGTNTSHGAIM
ncbi:HNH endonuclease [Rhodoflexus caldus]|uniref:HNH endonuclease n=1 Tax=Rhodoflexus caldus TaxID=2891236 RepID=UPI00374DD4DD